MSAGWVDPYGLAEVDDTEVVEARCVVRDWLVRPERHRGVPISQIRTLVRYLRDTTAPVETS